MAPRVTNSPEPANVEPNELSDALRSSAMSSRSHCPMRSHSAPSCSGFSNSRARRLMEYPSPVSVSYPLSWGSRRNPVAGAYPLGAKTGGSSAGVDESMTLAAGLSTYGDGFGASAGRVDGPTGRGGVPATVAIASCALPAATIGLLLSPAGRDERGRGGLRRRMSLAPGGLPFFLATF